MDELFTNARHPYTQGLLRAVPKLVPGRASEAAAVVGDPPSPIRLPSGCRFHPRCPIAQTPLCAEEEPVLTAGPALPEHVAACHFAWTAQARCTRSGGRARNTRGPMIERRTIRFDHELLAELELPCFEAHGDGDGPHLCLLAGIHGGEYSSIAAVVRFMNALDTSELCGRITAVPIVSMPSFRARTAFVMPQDGKNLNRCFPGSLDGTFSDVLARHVFDEPDRAERLPARPPRRRHGRGARAVLALRRVSRSRSRRAASRSRSGCRTSSAPLPPRPRSAARPSGRGRRAAFRP